MRPGVRAPSAPPPKNKGQDVQQRQRPFPRAVLQQTALFVFPAGGIAHDFNNIMGIVIGNAELRIQLLNFSCKAASLGVRRLLMKPYRIEDLATMLRELLDG